MSNFQLSAVATSQQNCTYAGSLSFDAISSFEVGNASFLQKEQTYYRARPICERKVEFASFYRIIAI